MKEAWKVDPLDPRAPSVDVWARMSFDERTRVCDSLPSEIERATPPEGDRHRVPKTRAMEALGEFFRRIGRRVYLSSELPVYYPNERVFGPDLIAVLDVEPHERDRWVVSLEGKGVDLAFEVTLAGDAKKDLEENVVRYARLGIPEYFVLDARTTRLLGYRLEAGASAYQPIVPQGGRWPSKVLGLDLSLEGGRVRFFHGSAPLLEASELITRLERMMEELASKKDEAERMKDEAERMKDEAERRAERLAQRLRDAGIDPDDS